MNKVLRIVEENLAKFHSVERAPMGEEDVRIAVRHVGLCGSDLNTFKGLNPLVQLPRIPGHEIGGEIVAAGSRVGPDYRPGRRVIVMPYTSCGKCSSCRKGRTNACRYNRTLGVQQDGGLAEEIVLPADKVILNDTLQPRHLALVEPLSVGFHAVERARIIAIDPSDEKLALAQAFGAQHVLPAGGEELVARVQELTADDGVDVAFEAVGLPATFTQAIDLAGFAGRVVYVGYSKAPVTYQTQFFNLKELDIMGSRNATLADFRNVIAHMEKMGAAADRLISRVFAFDDAEQALPYWSGNRDVLKIVIERG